LGDEELLMAYGEAEKRAESGEFIPYRVVLETVVRDLGKQFLFQTIIEEERSLAESVKSWPPFPDTITALHRLHSRFKLAIISNIDDDLFAETAKLLREPLDFVTTALQVRSYKPSLNNFRRALEKTAIASDKVLHVAQSRHHDIEPAQRLGIHTVWVNRRHGKKGSGATVDSSAVADLEVPDLGTLADLAGC
jgi:2-haloacid dehalogenase